MSISAAAKGSVELAISNVLGSNIMNVLLILGLASVIYPLAVKQSCLKVDIPFVFGISVLLPLLGIFDHKIGRIEGLLFWVLLILYIVYMIYLTKKGQEVEEEFEAADENDKFWKLALLILVGGTMIVLGSNVTVDAASALAKAFGMSERLIEIGRAHV